MKHRMNATKVRGQPELNRNRAKNLNDTKWSNKLGGELARGELEREIEGGKPNPLSARITRTLNAMPIGSTTGSGPRLTKSGPNRSPGAFAAFDKNLDRGRLRFSIGGGKQRGLVP